MYLPKVTQLISNGIWDLKPTLMSLYQLPFISVLKFQKLLPGQSTEKTELRKDEMFVWINSCEGIPKAWFKMKPPCPLT